MQLGQMERVAVNAPHGHAPGAVTLTWHVTGSQMHVTPLVLLLLVCGRQIGTKRNIVQQWSGLGLCTAAVAARQALLRSQFHQRHVDGVIATWLQLDDEGVLVAVVLDHIVIHSYSNPFLAPFKYVLHARSIYFVLALNRFR